MTSLMTQPLISITILSRKLYTNTMHRFSSYPSWRQPSAIQPRWLPCTNSYPERGWRSPQLSDATCSSPKGRQRAPGTFTHRTFCQVRNAEEVPDMNVWLKSYQNPKAPQSCLLKCCSLFLFPSSYHYYQSLTSFMETINKRRTLVKTVNLFLKNRTKQREPQAEYQWVSSGSRLGLHGSSISDVRHLRS